VLEDHAADLRTLFAETFFRAQVGAIEGRVVRQLTGPVDVRVKRLGAFVATIATVCFEQVTSTFRQRHRPLAAVERHRPN